MKGQMTKLNPPHCYELFIIVLLILNCHYFEVSLLYFIVVIYERHTKDNI